MVSGAAELEVPGQRGDPLRVRQRDLDGGGPGELQGAAHPGTQPELQDHLEGQPLGDQLPRVLRPGVLTREQPVHVLAAVQVGRDHGGQPLRRARLGDHVRDQVVQVRRAAVVVQDRRDQRAEGEGVGAAGHEPGAVRRVLHRVVEQQRLALRVLELPAGEQLGDRDRGQAGQARAEEPGAVVHPARRAPVMLGGVDAILVVPYVPEHRRRRHCRGPWRGPAGGCGRLAGSSTRTVTAPGWPVAQAVTSSPVAAISGRTRRLLDTAAR